LRFAVQWPGIPEASPRSHGVSRRDVSGRIHVSVASETAGGAHKARLTLARLPAHLPACRTALTRKGGFDLLDPARSLLLQAAHKQAPTGSQDAPVEPGLLADIPARVVPSAFRGSRHVPDLEGDVPAPCAVKGDPVGLHACWHGPRPTERHPRDFRYPSFTGLPAESGAVVPQHALLGERREQSVPGHTNTLANVTDISGEVKRRFYPDLQAEVSAPRSS
jgi:hypothetical protein